MVQVREPEELRSLVRELIIHAARADQVDKINQLLNQPINSMKVQHWTGLAREFACLLKQALRHLS